MIDDDRRVLQGKRSSTKKLSLMRTGDPLLRVYEFLIERTGQEPLIGGISIDVTELKMWKSSCGKARRWNPRTLAGGIVMTSTIC
jgi:hypothetical protein